jgi:hypothetical protein
MPVQRVVLATLWVLALLVAACEDASISTDPLLTKEYAIDPTFRDFYDSHGGESVLGQGISPLFPHNNLYYQYTLNVLMVQDPGAPDGQRFKLGALGSDMGIREEPVPQPEKGGVRYIQGHIIYGLFSPLYDALGGLRFTGAPLTEIHYNPEKRRFEQFFANLGFYWLEGDPADQVHLLAYGAWKCDVHCRTSTPDSAVVELPAHISKRFEDTVNRLGADFTGYAITGEYQTPDGFVEQVFENVVLVFDPQKPGRVFLRAVTERLGYRPDPLKNRDPNSKDYFVKIQGERGYAVPRRIYDYINLHSGFEVSGQPIGAISRVQDAVYQQCFTNLCIQAYLDALGNITVRPAPIGYNYRRLPIQELNQPEVEQAVVQEEAAPEAKDQSQPEAQSSPEIQTQPEVQPQVEEVQPTEAPSIVETESPAPQQPEATPPPEPAVGGKLIVQPWETLGMVAPGQSQEIGVSVFQGGQPMANVEPDLTVSLPDGTQKTYYMYPTGGDGQSKMQVDPVNADSGTLVPYKVCIYDVGGETVCVEDSFLVWGP